MKSVNRAKLDLIIAVTAFGTIGIFVRYINLPSSVIAFVRGAVGAVFLLLLLYLRRTPFRWASVQPHWKLLALSGAIISFNWITLFEAYRYTTVATATLCYYMAPVFVTLASPFLFHEKLTTRKLLCVLTALCGMVFVSGVPSPVCRRLERPPVSCWPFFPPCFMPAMCPSTSFWIRSPPVSGLWYSWRWQHW